MCPSLHLDCSDNHTRFSWASDCGAQHRNQKETLLLDSIYEVLLPEYYTFSRRGRGQQVSMRLSRHLQHMLFLRVQVPSACFQVFWRDYLGCYPIGTRLEGLRHRICSVRGCRDPPPPGGRLGSGQSSPHSSEKSFHSAWDC